MTQGRWDMATVCMNAGVAVVFAVLARGAVARGDTAEAWWWGATSATWLLTTGLSVSTAIIRAETRGMRGGE